MADLKMLVEREMDRAGSPSYAFEDLAQLRDRRRRTKQVSAAVVGLGLAIGLALLGSSILRSAPEPRPGVSGPAPLAGNGRIVVSQGLRGIWILDPEDPANRPELLVEDRRLPNVGLAFSPDGTRLAYAVSEPEREDRSSLGVWVLDLETGASEQIATCAPLGCPRLLDWSPDGSQLAVTDEDSLFLMDLDGNRGETLAFFDGQLGQPSWSPDGSRIAFSVRMGGFPDYGPSQLYSVAPDGSDLTLLLERRWNGVMDPAWSPDGTKIAYWDWGTDEAYEPETAPESAWPRIWVVDADGSDPTALYVDRTGTGPGGHFGGVSWSPDGTQIAFVLNWAFHIMDADGSNLRNFDFPRETAFAYRPAWQPIPAGS